MRRLLDMFDAHQTAAWDHTAQMLAAWSKDDVDPRDLNPYRARERRKRSGFTTTELAATRKALAARKAARASKD